MWRRQLLGIVGEFIAGAYFLAAGYQIKGWRQRFGRLEADLLVAKTSHLVVVEVKTGASSSFLYRPENQLNRAKVENLRKIARILSRSGGGEVSVELFVVDFSKIWPRLRRYPHVCLW